MAVTRNFDKPFELVDYSTEVQLIPNQFGLINELGIFRSESVSQHTITFESTNGTLGIITDQLRGARNLVNRDDTRTIRSYPVPHFPLDDAIRPEDIQGKRAYGSPDAAEQEAAVIARKLQRIRMNHAVTLETARAYAITNGAIYAPNGTVAGSYYSDFGVTRKEVDAVLGTATTNLVSKIEEVIAHTQDNILSGEVVNDIVWLCSPEFFSKFIDHASVKAAYQYYTSTQEPLRTRLGSGIHRRFVHGGVTLIEMRDSYNGQRLIPAGDAYSVPMGTMDTFITYYSPANKFQFVNTLGEQLYTFLYRGLTDEEIVLQSEANFINLIRRPQAICRIYSSN